MKTTTQKKDPYIFPCGATAKDTSKERGRFLRRHPFDPFELTDISVTEHVAEQRRMKAAAEAKAAAKKGA